MAESHWTGSTHKCPLGQISPSSQSQIIVLGKAENIRYPGPEEQNRTGGRLLLGMRMRLTLSSILLQCCVSKQQMRQPRQCAGVLDCHEAKISFGLKQWVHVIMLIDMWAETPDGAPSCLNLCSLLMRFLAQHEHNFARSVSCILHVQSHVWTSQPTARAV